MLPVSAAVRPRSIVHAKMTSRFEYLPQLSQKRIILGSASPRRRELLQQIGLAFEVLPSTFKENLPKEKFGAAEYAALTAAHKAEDVFTENKVADADILVIGADTVVEYAGLILEKPGDEAEAFEMLSMLSGQQHHVHTGCAIVTKSSSGDGMFTHKFSVTTTVDFDELSPAIIKAYIASGEPFDKAGGYGIQGPAAAFVKSLHGDYFNVVGFPLNRFVNEVLALVDEGKISV